MGFLSNLFVDQPQCKNLFFITTVILFVLTNFLLTTMSKFSQNFFFWWTYIEIIFKIMYITSIKIQCSSADGSTLYQHNKTFVWRVFLSCSFVKQNSARIFYLSHQFLLIDNNVQIFTQCIKIFLMPLLLSIY